MPFLKRFWEGWKVVAARIGGFISTTVLTVFYFVVMPFFAIPFQLFGKSLLKGQSPDSNWIVRTSTPSTLKELQEEF